jgi:hypothetical protein
LNPPWKNGEVRMVYEEFGSSLMRIHTDHRKSTHLIAGVVSTVQRHLLGFSQWATHLDDGGPMLLNPGVPCRHACLFLRAPLAIGERIPRHTSRTQFAAEVYGEIRIACAHDTSFLEY